MFWRIRESGRGTVAPTNATSAVMHGLLLVATALLTFAAGISTPIRPAFASADLIGWGVENPGITPEGGQTPGGGTVVPDPAPDIHEEPEPSPDLFSDSVGATPATFRVDEGGSSTYTIPIYVPPGTADFSPKLTLSYQQRGGNGALGVGFGIGGLSSITRCRKAKESGDGDGVFPAINFDTDATNDAYCLEGARLWRSSGAGSCPAATGTSATFQYGLETDPATRVCGYETAGITGPAFWLVQPKDGSYRRYGRARNSTLPRNDGAGTVDTTQILTWNLDRLADASGNVIEFSYLRDAAQGEINIDEVNYTGRVAISNLLEATPTYARAPYNTVKFNYTAMPSAGQRADYLSGMKLSLTQQLASVTVRGTANHGANPDAQEIVRTYYLEYGTPTGSGNQAMSAVRECAPGGGSEVCYPRTRFTWNGNQGATQGFPILPTTSSYSTGLQYAIDFKIADVNGDGRQDLVWLKDGSCDGTSIGGLRFQLMTSLASSTGSGPSYAAPIATGIYLNRPPSGSSLPTCGGDMSSLHFETLWHVYDFTGDGRDDILVGNGTAWYIHPAVNNGTTWTYSGSTATATGMSATSTDDGKLVDLNGDGLPDFLRGSPSIAVNARFLRRSTSSTIAYDFTTTDTAVDFESPTPPSGFTDVGLTFASTRAGVPPSADLDGDGASDLMAKVTFEGPTSDACPLGANRPGTKGAAGYLPSSDMPEDIEDLDCKRFWYTYRNAGIQSNGRLYFAVDTNLGEVNTAGGLSGAGGDFQLADVNGDGQADAVYQRSNAGQRTFYVRLNRGTAAPAGTGRLLPEQATGLSLTSALASRVQLLDVNGDGKLDLFYATSAGGGSYPLKARRFGLSNFNAEVDVGNATSNAQNPTATPTFLIDVTGDGVPDLVRMSPGSISIAIGSLTFGGNDVITYIVNGLGAVNTIGYAPLPYSSVYDRGFNGPSKIWGRGSPVFDVFTSMWVVRNAAQSAPTAANPLTTSAVRYYYSGARMQAGGRGFLGFQTIRTEDIQNLLVTTTEYRQDYPYTGRPVSTVVEKLSAPLPDPCASNPNAAGCFKEPPTGCGPLGCPIAPGAPSLLSVGGQLLNDSATVWNTTPAFNPATWQSVHVYASSTDEQKFDLASPGQLSFQIASSFVFDTYGNLTGSTVTSRHVDGAGSLLTDETKTTTNIYGCTTSPPTPSGCGGGSLNAERQRLGRLSISTVDSSRPGTTAVRRRASFEYDATRLLLTAEIQGPYEAGDGLDLDTRKRLNMRTDYVLDNDGNRVAQYQCDTGNYANRSACTDLSSFKQRQDWVMTPPDPTRFQRYGKTVFEDKGRFPLSMWAPFYSATAPNQTDENVVIYTGVAVTGSVFTMMASPSAIVMNRNAFGDPLNRVSSTGMLTTFAYGFLGRARFETSTTGNFALSTYTWCQDVTTALVPDVPSGAPRANCPTGAIFRVMTSSVASVGVEAGRSAAPTQFTYFDRLGRQMLATTRIYQKDNASLNRWSSIATTYDDTGRTKTTTVPYFSADPTTSQSVGRAGTALGSAPAQTVTSYDQIGRAALIDHPEQPANGTSSTAATFDKLATEVINPRSFHSKQSKNALDELVSAEDAAGLVVNYDRDAIGNLVGVRRTPNDGDSAGASIATTLSYDRLGRKTGMVDPDKGTWTYRYNALGELIEQIDGKGQAQRVYRDALGRMYKRTEDRLSGGSYVAEPTSTWEYDTPLRPSAGTKINGVPKTESNGAGFARTYGYDEQGRLLGSATTLDTTTYIERIVYDEFGRLFQHFAPNVSTSSTAGEQTEYSADAYPILTTDTGTGTVYNEVMALTARGQVRQERFHNNANFATLRTYDDNTGRMLVLATGNSGGASAVQSWEYTYDKHADVTSRWNRTSGYDMKEDFTYDNLDRLKTVTLSRLNGVSVSQTQTVTYDQLGNIKTRGDGSSTSTWTYGAAGTSGCVQAAGRHAVSKFDNNRYCYDANGNQIEARYPNSLTRTITYTGYDLPETIATNGYPASTTVSFKYGPDRSMWKRVDGPINSDRIFCSGFESTACAGGTGGSVASTTYYVGNLEIRVEGSLTTTKRNVGSYLVVTTTSAAPTPQYAYLFRDALGSLDAITNEAGVVQQRLGFDAWGKRRYAEPPGSGTLWSPLPAWLAAGFDTSRTRQGYTGHQQLDGVGLVHMKGRLYDPELGRFIQADDVLEPDATQGLNRYSYVLNNPLSLTDPTGHLSARQWVGLAIAVVAAYFGQYWLSKNIYVSFLITVGGGFASAYVATGSWRAGLWGAFAAGVFWGIGTGFNSIRGDVGTGVFGSGFTSGQYVAKIAAHGAAGGVLSELQGGNFGNGFLAAGATQAVAPMIDAMPPAGQLVASAIVGGTVSEATGGTFANGAVTATFQFLFNDALHEMGKDAQEELYKIMESRGIEFVKQAQIKVTLKSGEEVIAVADYIARDGDKIIFGEIKDGMGSKLSRNQKLVYAAIERGEVMIVNAANAARLGLTNRLVGKGVGKFVLHALENSRSAKQATRIFGKGVLAGMKIFGSAAFTGVTLFFEMKEVTPMQRILMEYPQLYPSATYDTGSL